MPKIKFSEIKKKIITEQRQIVTLTVTRKCNLRCKYCYESNEHRNIKPMAFKTAKDVITRYMEADNEFNSIEWQFFGGEPMLEFSLIKEIIEWFKTQSWKKRFIFFISSNGTILTEEMKTWLKKNRRFVAVGISLDGNRTAHNISRDNSYDLLLPNIPFFQENWPTQPAKMTICKENIPYLAESVIELEERGILFTANIVFEDIWGDAGEKEELLKIYQDQLDLLVDYYSKNPHLEPVGPILTHHIESFDRPYPKTTTLDSECTRFCGSGHEMVMVDVDGALYPCHRFAPWVSKKTPPKNPPNRQREWKPDKCNSCKITSNCPTCAGFNWEINGDSGIRTTYHCEALKIEFLASAKLHALRLNNLNKSRLNSLSNKELLTERVRLETIFSLLEEGI